MVAPSARIPGVPLAHELPRIDRNSTSRNQGSTQAPGATRERPLAEPGPPLVRRWNTWDIAFLPVVDTA